MRIRKDTRRRAASRRLALALLLFGAGLGPLAEPASGELRKVEAVGIFGIRDGARARVIPRDQAINEAIWEGVSRVARDVIGESAPGEGAGASQGFADDADAVLPPIDAPTGRMSGAEGSSGEGVAVLRKALGDDLLPYTRGFRILEDRGEVPVLFQEEPDVRVEYVVVVEVVVDEARVTRALEGAGLVARVDAGASGEAIRVELVGLSRYEAFRMVLGALEGELGATRVSTVEFERDRQILTVEGPFGPEALSARLAGLERPDLILEPIGIDREGRRIRMLGRWFGEAGNEDGRIDSGRRRGSAS